jgi:hypothetical protein
LGNSSAKLPPPTTIMGIVVVTRCATPAVVLFGTTITSTWSRTTSSTRVANRSRLPSAQRHSNVKDVSTAMIYTHVLEQGG